ncbi:MAG: diphthine synthase [Candidatus Aenigmatarchaeota archaeon]|nr:MAG: diphthine synthase [Candidatus Aenigmarchaeota archaeon]
MLYLVGIGMEEKDLSLKAIEAMVNSQKVYIESYTSKWLGFKEDLEKLTRKKIETLDRKDMEEGVRKILKEAKERSVAILVPGDPLTATTHIEVILSAKKDDLPVKIIHAPSIFSVVAETGLQIYKFGETVSLPRPRENYKPVSWMDKIYKNLEHGLHTLVLLDVEPQPMTIKEAIKIIKESDEKKLLNDKKIIACSCLGTEKRLIRCDVIENLIKCSGDFDTPACIVIPGNLHFKEEEALKMWSE